LLFIVTCIYFRLDEDLFVANNLSSHSLEWNNFLTETKGQLFYLIAVFLLKRAQKVNCDIT